MLIYFDLPSKTRVVTRLLDHLAPGGYLFLGFAETATGINDQLVSVGPNVYARAEPSVRSGGSSAFAEATADKSDPPLSGSDEA